MSRGRYLTFDTDPRKTRKPSFPENTPLATLVHAAFPSLTIVGRTALYYVLDRSQTA